jgi:tetratricopeptide (TPR) repeat protein
MKKIIAYSILMSFSFLATAQGVAEKILYGITKKENLADSPYASWFVPAYNNYQPDGSTITSLEKIAGRDISIEIFLGTWCGDSKREVPRFMKIVDKIPALQKKTTIISVGGSDSLYKQSPTNEDRGKGVFRVPVFIVYRNGVEINRIIEFPAVSLEKDLFNILDGKDYVPNYRSFATIKSWLANGTLLDKNSSSRGLATQLRALVSNEYELNSLGFLLLRQDRKEEALKILQINASLYPESANVISSLGEACHQTGDDKNAVLYLERSLELNKDPQLVKKILKILYEAKGVKG